MTERGGGLLQVQKRESHIRRVVNDFDMLAKLLCNFRPLVGLDPSDLVHTPVPEFF